MKSKRIFSVVALAVFVFASAASAQQPTKRGIGTRAVSQTGYGVAINNPESNTDSIKNPSQKPIIVIASCNATSAPKDIEAWVGQNDPTTVQNMVASLSGNGRQTITFVVPWGWYYYINVSQQPVGGGIPSGGVCRATAWWTD
jgi:hypothetical protein